MDILVKPTQKLKGRVTLPGSKSYSIRAFMIAHCAPYATIVNPSNCDDAKVSIRVIKQLGSIVSSTTKNVFSVTRSRRAVFVPTIDVGESGTVLRLLLPLASLRQQPLTITGQGTLRGRPNAYLVSTLQSMGKRIVGSGKNASVPIKIDDGSLKGGRIAIDGSLSSQFISALLMTCPQLKEDSRIVLKGNKLVSSDYITMTLQVLKQCGISIKPVGRREFIVKGNQAFEPLKHFKVPSDSGLAAFLMAGASLVSSDVTLEGFLSKQFIQADSAIFSFLKKMGVRMSLNEKQIRIKGPFALRGGTFSLKDCPDLVPIMAVLGLFAKGTTRLIDIAHARAKESDRISDLRKELLKVGADIRETKETLSIYPKPLYKSNVILNPHSDHRMAMAFCILGLKVGVRVKDIECTHKSYPDFCRDLKSLGSAFSLVKI